jgi:hypothetical protein
MGVSKRATAQAPGACRAVLFIGDSLSYLEDGSRLFGSCATADLSVLHCNETKRRVKRGLFFGTEPIIPRLAFHQPFFR